MTTHHATRLLARALLTAMVGVVAIASSSAGAKPLYITVNRAFSPAEEPVVDVAFMGTEPVELRVLQPKDLERYIAGQENLRRSWDRPDTQENPGRALSRGLNAMKTPGTFLLYALNAEMRKALGDDVAARGDDDETTTRAVVAEGPKKLVGIPADFDVVRRQWLNLDLGGDPRAFDVPGFEGWSRTSSGFEERRVKLKKLPAGVYVLQLVQGTVEGQVVLVVTDLTMQVKQTDGHILARVADSGQQPVKGATVVVRQKGKGPLTATTNEMGEAMLPATDPKLLVTASRPVADGKGNDVAIVDTDFYSSLAASPDVFLYSDRPIYKPGDDVQFRGIVRKPDGFLARLFSPNKREVTVQLVSIGPGGTATAAATTKLTVDALGSFAGGLSVPASAEEGVFRLLATLDGMPHVGEVRVQAYVKPTFFIEMTPGQESVAPGGVLTAKLKAERYAGGPPANTAYEVTLTRTLLDSPAWVDDAGLGGEGSAVTYGSASTTEGKLSVPDRLYSSVTERIEAGTADWQDTWKSAPTFAEDGTAEVTVQVPALKEGEAALPYKYVLSVRARDDQGSFAAASQPYYLSPVDVMGALRLSTKVTKTSGSPELLVRSTSLGGKVMPGRDGSVTFVVRTARGDEKELAKKTFTTDAAGVAKLPVPVSDVGAVYARVVLKDAKGAEWTGEERLLVVGDKGEAVEWVPELSLTTLAPTVSPGDTADVIALLPEEWGPGGKEKGPLWLTLSGTDIFSTKLINAEGRTVVVKVPIEKRFGSAVYVSLGYPTRSGRWSERTLPLRIIPTERVLTVKSTAARAEVEPLGEQTIRFKVSDHRGRGVSQAQVSVSVVDKAVYAVQPEFRPRVLEFFYPLVRHNVADFFSAEFQGYGYGHLLAKRLGDGGVQFAMVKPPKKKADERDTAYWNGSVITDEDGFAEVTFTMPSNQTLWVITAVAADGSGRVGEGTAQFASRGKALVHTAAPEFLRQGDEATATVRVSRGATSDWQGTVTVDATGTGVEAKATSSMTIDLTAAREGTTTVALRGTKAGPATLALAVSGGPQPLQERRAFDVEEAVVVDDVAVSRVGGGALALEGPAGASLTDVELTLAGGVADAILGDVRDLLVYPYGCLEQLVATTAPPVSLVLALQEQERFATLDPDSQLLLAEARSRAQHGVSRILSYGSGGAFGWFPGADGSVEMTLLALGGLAPADKAGLLAGRQQVIGQSIGWLETQGGLSPFLDAWRALVIAQHAPARAQARARAAVAAAGGDVVVGAVAVLAAEAAGIADEAGTADQVKGLARAARSAFVGGTMPTDDDDSWRFPLRGVGRLALLGHAARLDGGDVAPLKKRFLELFAEEGLSTLDRATLVQHSLWLLAHDVKATQAMSPPKVDGAGDVTFSPRGTGLVARLKDGTKSVTVGAFDGVARLSAKQKTPLKDVAATSQGFTIERRYWSIGSGAKTPMAPGASVAQGDLVWVQLTLDLKGEPRGRSAYTVVKDFIPAGFSPVREDKLYRGAPLELPLVPLQVKQRTFSPRAVTFFIEEPAWWMGSPREVGYVMRADFAGTFVAPPAQVEDMYAAKAKARTAAQTLSIAPSSNAK
jgi:alpha-2-macroglobulin